MAEELNTATASPAPEGAPPSPTPAAPAQPAPQQAAPAEPEPKQYLTRDEALSIVNAALEQQRRQYEQTARDQGSRAAQSFLDKRKLNERVSGVEQTLERLVQDGLLDASQVSAYRDEARWRALTDLLPEAEEPQPGGGTPQQAQDPLEARAYQLINEAGLTPQDPEYAMLYGHDDPFSWHIALQTATSAKAARLARAQAQANAQPPPAQPAPAGQPPAPTGAQAVEVGAGGGAAVTDLATLRQQYLAASRKGDRKRSQELYKQIQALTVGAAAK